MSALIASLVAVASPLCVQRGLPADCASHITIEDRRAVDARNRAGRITVTTGMAKRTTRDGLAFVIAHEMAHSILRHAYSTPERELEADQVGALIVRAAGYDTAAAIALIRRFAHRTGPTHPSARARIAALEERN